MKWSIREAVDVYFKAKAPFKLGARTIKPGEPILIFDTVKTATLEVAAESSYTTGGRGNARILSFEGDKTLPFNFEEALLSAEGLAILAGADLIPARNKRLKGAPGEAKSVISHVTERFVITRPNIADNDLGNTLPKDTSLGTKPPKGGNSNIWLKQRPYLGKNSSIYVMLLDQAGEMSGAPLEISLTNSATDKDKSFIEVFKASDAFVAFDRNGLPMKTDAYPKPTNRDTAAAFDDKVAHYVDYASAKTIWNTAWGNLDDDFKRTIEATSAGAYWGDHGSDSNQFYSFLLPGADGPVAKAFFEGGNIVYRANAPSFLAGDVVLIDYYVEKFHDAVEIAIRPDKFAPFVYVEGASLLRRASDGLDVPVEFEIPKFKIMTQLSFTLQGTGDPSTFNFQGEAYPDFGKFDPTERVLANIRIIGADDNYDGGEGAGGDTSTPSYRRYRYNENTEGSYIWKDPAQDANKNLDYSDTEDYDPTHGGPITKKP